MPVEFLNPCRFNHTLKRTVFKFPYEGITLIMNKTYGSTTSLAYVHI